MSTSYLNGAHDLHIQSLSITHQVAVASKAFDHLHDNVAADAMHNSGERCSISNCYPETRKVVQEEIHSWITDGDDGDEPKKIMWMTGPAGSGKTAIAGTIAEICEDEGILAGSFFFSSFAGSETRLTKRFLVATLAYCLLQHDELQQLRVPILSAIERDPSIFRRSLSAQCKALILKPLRDVWQRLVLSDLPAVFVIDGLDEVEAVNSRQLEARKARLANEAEQTEILSTLLQAARNPNFPFRILVVSRPEPVIRDLFSRSGDLVKEVFLDDKYDPHSDISLFLKAKFGEIRGRYRLPTSWPGEEIVERLRVNASGQFIYAATVVRFLQTSDMHPQARLDCVLQANTAHGTRSTVFSSLDALYTQILRTSPDPILATRWIGAISFFAAAPALFVRQFLQQYRGQADYLLENLASLLSLPATEDQRSPILIYHKSLHDFLREPGRCGSEICEAYRNALFIFLRDHYVQVLKDRSPTVSLADAELPSFLMRFVHTVPRFCILMTESTLGPWDDAMLTCDVPWWVRSVLGDPQEARALVIALFRAVHYQCVWARISTLGYSSCRPPCKYWRSKILAVCKAMGWRVPNAVALLRERMRDRVEWKEGHKASQSLHYNGLITAFDPPSAGTNNLVTAGTPPKAPADDYESICSLAYSMYDRLPVGWSELYKKQLAEGKTPLDALQPEIGRIMGELGVEIEDVYPFVS